MNWNQRDSILYQRLQLLQEYHTLPLYMLRRISKIELNLMGKNINNLSPVKMPHCSFKRISHAFNTGVGKCSCGQTFDYAPERDMKMKLRMHPLQL